MELNQDFINRMAKEVLEAGKANGVSDKEMIENPKEALKAFFDMRMKSIDEAERQAINLFDNGKL